MPRRSRRAFTLIEALVAVSVIGLLIALILPAVQSARQAAARLQCANNLKQFGLAIHSYAAAYRMFPIGTGGQRGYALHVSLLPYLEQAAVYNAFNLSIPAAEHNYPGPNATGFVARIALFTCPSDPDAFLGMTNYGGCLGDYRSAYSANGVFTGGPVALSPSPTVSRHPWRCPNTSSGGLTGPWTRSAPISHRRICSVPPKV